MRLDKVGKPCPGIAGSWGRAVLRGVALGRIPGEAWRVQPPKFLSWRLRRVRGKGTSVVEPEPEPGPEPELPRSALDGEQRLLDLRRRVCEKASR